MKKLVIVLLLGLLIAGSVFAQWGYGYSPAAYAPQLITGTLQIINGMMAIVGYGNQVYYVPNLQPYYGVNGMYPNTTVSVYGNLASNNYIEPFSFLVKGTWYSLPTYNYNYVPYNYASYNYAPYNYAPYYYANYTPYYYTPYYYALPSQSIYVPFTPSIAYPAWYGWYWWW